MKRLPPLLAILLLCAAVQPVAAQQPRLIVSAAASLSDVLTALTAEAEASVGAKILWNFGGSGSLRKQIEEGAPADLFFSASSEDMDALDSAGRLEPGTRRDLLSNSMVLVGDAAPGEGLDAEGLEAALAGARLLAIGNPDTVPAGRYAVQALKNLGLYALVEKKLVLGGSVREVLQYAQSGSAPLGIVFLTDALTLKPGGPLGLLYRFPESALTSPVVYPIAIVSASKAKDRARLLLAFLQGNSAREAFARAGFLLR
jgi:molybdate transport system substrate-binding protein